MASHIQSLPEGPLAIIGDIHGEIEALDALLSHLGQGYPDYHLVFLGDLADRGPDSPAVIRRVQDCVRAGAQCVFGNHELSVVRREEKKYNGWFFPEAEPWTPRETNGAVVPMAGLGSGEHDAVRSWFADMPLALERQDLRVVHACWDERAIGLVRDSDDSILSLFEQGSPATAGPDKPAALTQRGTELKSRDPEWEAYELAKQNGNPIAVLTSGKERPAGDGDAILWSGNQWRPLVRDRWWERYDHDIPVVIGHYSRKWRPSHLDAKTRFMFGETNPAVPVGLRKNVYCIDFGAGTRFEDRAKDRDYRGRLAALLWHGGLRSPQLLFDDGVTCPTSD